MILHRLIIALALLLLPVGVRGTPSIVQVVNGPGIFNTPATTSYTLHFPNPGTLTGNAIACFFNSGTGNTGGTLTDNKSNVYTLRVNVAGNQRTVLFDVFNATAGVTTITFSPSAGVNNIQGICAELTGVATTAAADGTCSAALGSGTNVACSAALTTTVSGDILLHYGVEDTTPGGCTSWTHGASPWDWVSMGTDIQICQALQWQVQPTAGAITPAMTQAPTNNFDTIAVAYKAAAAGTAPTGMYIAGVGHATISGGKLSPFTVTMPCTGNLVVLDALFVDAVTVTQISDGTTNATAAGAQVALSGSGNVRHWFYPNYGCSTAKILTVTFTGTNQSGDTMVMYDVVGAAASPLDTAITCGTSTLTGNTCTITGNDLTAGSHVINTATIVPSTASGIVFGMQGVTNPEPMNAVTPGTFTACVSVPEATSGDMDENNGFWVEFNTSTLSRQYGLTAPAGGAGNWAASAVHFLAPAGGGGGGSAPQLTLTHVGVSGKD